jgi:HAE1 family hydrophobic/amphiphilic exporter-1
MLRAALERPIAVSMLFAALLLVGGLSYSRLAVDLLPSIVYPRLTVLTVYEDIPAEDLERLVTQRLEEAITAQTGVRNVFSRTREGVSIITVEYEWGTQMDFANLHLREAVDRVAFREDFPEAADRPVILRWDPSSRPISILVLEATGRLEALTEFAREVVKPALEQVDGISRAEVVGGADREILVEPDPRKMAVYGIDVEEIRRALVRSNISFPGGKVRQGPLHLSLRIDGEFEQLGDIAATHIGLAGGAPVRIGDVARVVDTVKEAEGATLLGGRTVVSMLIYKEPEANTLLVSQALDEALSVVSSDYADFRYDFVYRDAAHVRASFEGLVQALVLGGALAILVLFVFLGDWRSPWVVGLAIPVSIVITFGLLFFGDVKLNLMSLGGLSLAAGMLVDNSIVVLENINRHLAIGRRMPPEKKDAGSPLQPTVGRRQVAFAAYDGTREVARPVVAASLTTIAVFFPVVYVPGIAGAFFRDQALTVTFSLMVSVAAALLLQPVLSARILRPSGRGPRGLFRLFAWGLERIHDLYHPALVRALRHPALFLMVTLLGLVGAGFWATNLERSFLPQRSLGDVRIDLELPAGTPLEQTVAQVADLASFIERQEGVRVVFSQVGQTERTLAAVQDFSAPNTARVRVILEPGRGAFERGEEIRQIIAGHLGGSAEIVYAFREEGIGLGEILGTGGAEFGLGVIAERPRDALEAADDLLAELDRVEGLVDLQMDRVLGTTNVVVRLDREQILRHGLDPERMARELQARVAGVEATFFNEVDQRIDIAIRLPLDERRNLSSALATSIRLDGGQTVPLSSFLVIEEERPVRELKRRNQQRWVTISGNLEGRSIESVWEETEAIAESTLLGGVQIVEEGERKEMRRSFRDLAMAMVLAMLLVYMILAGQFESFLDPLLIAAVIPIGLAGAVVAIGVTGGSINVLSLIGALALLGIAVNDAIVKVDTIRRLRTEGVAAGVAILEASRLRLRPILMTSATTVLAMIPMAIGLGSGEQLQRPLAITIIGGLTLTTLLTLFVTPALYQLAHRIKRPQVA